MNSLAVKVLRDGWWLVVAGAVLGLVASTVLLFVTPKQYSSDVTVYIAAQANQSGADSAYQGSLLSEQRTRSFAALVDSPRVLQQVRAEAGVNLSDVELASRLSASAAPETVLVKISYKDSSPVRSAAVVNSAGDAFVRLVGQLETATSRGKAPAVVATVVDRATPPVDSVSPNTILYLTLGIFFGSIAGAGLAVGRTFRRTPIRKPSQVESAADVSLFAAIPADRDVESQPVCDSSDQGARAESYRTLRTSIRFADVDVVTPTIGITSSIEGEGKTTVAANLAYSLASSGERVLLIDCDLRRPRVASMLNLEKNVGLTSVLSGRLNFRGALQTSLLNELFVLTSGAIPPNPSELLGSKRMLDLLEEAKAGFDFILLDSPPLLPVADASIVAARCDGVVLVARHGKVSEQQVKLAVAKAKSVSGRVFGSVLNAAPSRRLTQDYGSYYRADSAFKSPSHSLPSDDGVTRPSPVPRTFAQAPTGSRHTR